MHGRIPARLALVSLVVLLAGCSGGSPGKPLQLRVVTSSTDGPCSAAALTSAGPGSACSREGDTTYALSKSLGTITPASVTLSDDEGAATSVSLHFTGADSDTLEAASRKALNKQLAIVLDGRVLTAPHVMDALSDSDVSMATGSAAEAKQLAAELRATKAP